MQTSFGKQNVCLKSYKVVKTEFNLGYNNILESRSWTTFLVLRFDRGMDTYRSKMKNKKYHTVGTIPKSNRKIVERGKIDTPNIHIEKINKLLKKKKKKPAHLC